MTALAALAAAAIAPPDAIAVPATLEAVIRQACAGAWRAVEVVLAGDVLRGRLGKTRDAIVRDAVEGVLALHGNVGIRPEALASLRAARDAGALEGRLDLDAVVAETRAQGAVAVGRSAVASVRRSLAEYRDLELVLADAELGSLLVDTARAIVRTLSRDPELARWAIGPTGSPARDRALSAFAELASSPDSIAELEALIALPIHLDDNVQFTVYRPRSIDPGRWHQLLAFAHLAERRPGEDDLPDPVEEVQRQAAAVLGDKAKQYQPVVQDSGAAIPAEGELTFVPEFPGIEVNPPRRSFLWLESVHREEFRIRAGRELDGKTVRGRVTVFLGHIAIAEVACAVKVDAARPEPTKREPTSVRAYRKIFASYSHRDIEVVNQFETYARALGDEYLRDWVHLRTGEVWTDRLCQLIDQADAFQLFWSRNSMHSQFVRQEYEYALSLNRASFVRPTYWEDPMPTAPGLPPESLLRLHFQKLGREQLGAAGRAEVTNAAVARKKRAEPKADKKLDKMEVERERHVEDHDVTDPQYALPEMLTPSASMTMPMDPPAPDEDLEEAAPTTLKEEEPAFDNARVQKESRRREIADARSITTEPGVGVVGTACAMCGHRNPPDAKFCLNCGTPSGPTGLRPPAAAPAKTMMADPASMQPISPTAKVPTTSPGIAPHRPSESAASSARPSAPAPAKPSLPPSGPPPMSPAPSPRYAAQSARPSAPAPAIVSAPPAAPMPAPPGLAAAAPGPVAKQIAPITTEPGVAPSPRAPGPVSAPPDVAKVAPPEPVMAQPAPAMPGQAAMRQTPSPIPTTSLGVAPTPPAASPIAPTQPAPVISGIRPAPSSPIPTTSPGVAPSRPSPISEVSARPQRPSEAPAPSEPRPAPAPGPSSGLSDASPWSRPDAAKEVAGSMVSPYAPTVPQETYKPAPGEVLFGESPKLAEASPGARRSMLPLVLVSIGVLALLAVILIWLLR